MRSILPDWPDKLKNIIVCTDLAGAFRFDERISKYAEWKFQRDGLNVLTGCQVRAVTEKEIVVRDKVTGKNHPLPYGLAVWSTGIATCPVVAKLMEQIGQKDRRVLATDEWLRVKGCTNIYALGDCATIEQRKIMEDIASICKLADTDNSGSLTAKEFRAVMESIRSRYPQVDLYIKHKRLRNMMDIFDEKIHAGKDSEVSSIEEFKDALCHVDSQMKAVPATAQVAAQEGEYLAKCFNHMGLDTSEPEGPLRITSSGRHRFKPFRYRHFGMFVPLGGEMTAAELPGDWVSIGRSTMWLWYSVYLS